MKGKKLYIKLFFVKVVVKNKDLKPAFKELSFFPNSYGSEMRWKCNRRFFIFKSAGHFSIRCFFKWASLAIALCIHCGGKKKKKENCYLQ